MDGKSSYCRFLEGEREAIIEIVREYHSGLVLFLNTVTGNVCLSEEIAEDVFCEIMLRKPEFSGKSSFRTWLYSIGRHLAVRAVRRAGRFDSIPADEHYELTDEADIEREHLRGEQRIALHRALKKLRPDYSQVLCLVYIEDFSNAEAAKIMDKSSRQIENLLYRAKKALKKELEQEGFVYEAI